MKRITISVTMASMMVFGGLIINACQSNEPASMKTTQNSSIQIENGLPVAMDAAYLAEPSDPTTGFAENAFPPTIPDTDWHADAWVKHDCLRCHETGVANAPMVVHKSMPGILLTAMCRSCHVIEPGKAGTMTEDKSALPADANAPYAINAFPPMLPNSESHRNAWTIEDCLLCHADGIQGAPKVQHNGLPSLYLKVKCRTCHVQVRAIDDDAPEK